VEAEKRRAETAKKQQQDKEERVLKRLEAAYADLDKIRRELKEKVAERKQIQMAEHHREVEDEHVAKAAEKRLQELRRAEQKLDRETDARERTELRLRTRLKQLQDELDRIGGAPVGDAADAAADGEETLEKERQHTKELRGEVEALERRTARTRSSSPRPAAAHAQRAGPGPYVVRAPGGLQRPASVFFGPGGFSPTATTAYPTAPGMGSFTAPPPQQVGSFGAPPLGVGSAHFIDNLRVKNGFADYDEHFVRVQQPVLSSTMPAPTMPAPGLGFPMPGPMPLLPMQGLMRSASTPVF